MPAKPDVVIPFMQVFVCAHPKLCCGFDLLPPVSVALAWGPEFSCHPFITLPVPPVVAWFRHICAPVCTWGGSVKRPRQQPAHPQYANYWAPLTRKRHTLPHSAQSQHTNYWAPRTRKRHQQEHRPQRPTESSDPTQHAKGRTGVCPGPRKGATTRRNVTQGGAGVPCRVDELVVHDVAVKEEVHDKARHQTVDQSGSRWSVCGRAGGL